MSRSEKKCLVASASMHLFLLLLVLTSSAFFVSKEKQPLNLPSLKVVPSSLVEEALSGGGGNPKVAPTEAQQKGETLTPQPPPEARPLPPQPKPPAPTVEAKKPEPKPPIKPNPAKARETAKAAPKPSTNPKAAQKKPAPLELTPVVRTNADKQKEREQAEARELAAVKGKVASALRATKENLKAGFSRGTAVEVHGTGGAAYANYLQFVQAAYDEKWHVAQDVADDDAAALISVTIRRDGQVMSARIVRRSGNSILDRSVQRALDTVRYIRPFPESAKEIEKTFTIEFSLKAKRLTG